MVLQSLLRCQWRQSHYGSRTLLPLPREQQVFLCLKGLYPTEATKPTAQESGSRQVICFYKNSQNRRAVRWMGESWGGHLTERPCAAGLGACLQVSGYCEDWSSHPLVDTWGWGEAELGSESPIKQTPGRCVVQPLRRHRKKKEGGREGERRCWSQNQINQRGPCIVAESLPLSPWAASSAEPQ